MLAEYADFYDYSSSYPEGEAEDADSEVRTGNKGIEERSTLFLLPFVLGRTLTPQLI
jgi:hypothetical protein